MNYILHKANTRGFANHGWLKTYHTFSFANYYDPNRVHFGALRVLNDDEVIGGEGFDTHPHDNMEIVSIPLEGELRHGDSMGNGSVIKKGEIQVMSAGTGVYHSEYNNLPKDPVKFLQIWVFPNKKNVTPRYDQISYNKDELKNNFLQIVSPNKDDAGAWVHQNTWFYLSDIKKNKTLEYKLKSKSNGLYIFVLNGDIEINEINLSDRDGIGITDTDSVNFKANKDTSVLLMEVPMSIS
jgi:redox-sensitive bicupin YhaK (pirin superfamily)